MSWPDGECYLRPPQSLVVSLLLFLLSTLLFSRTGGVLSHQNSFDTQVCSISTEKLVLPRHARCVLSRLRCNGHSLLVSSYLSRIGRIENPSCSACGHPSQDISHLILHCPATDSLRRSLFGDSLSLYDLWSRPWGVAWLLGLQGLPPCPHPTEGVGQATTTTTTIKDDVEIANGRNQKDWISESCNQWRNAVYEIARNTSMFQELDPSFPLGLSHFFNFCAQVYNTKTLDH